MKTKAEYQMRLVDRQRIARDRMAFWFDTNGDARFEFLAGQHADFSFSHPFSGNEIENTRTFSLASSPLEKGPVMIATRNRGTAFHAALQAAPLGTRFTVSRPQGSFTLHRDITRAAVFIAGGIGIAPIRSIVQQATLERLPHRSYLFYSNRQVEDAAFLKEIENMTAQNPNLTLVPTLTGHRTAAWPYEKGRISCEMLRRYVLWLNGPIYYIAGPSRMVSAMTDLLASSGVSDDDVKTEEFGDNKLYQDTERSDSRSGANPANLAPCNGVSHETARQPDIGDHSKQGCGRRP
jgi:ferredoxin-NADP reductase